MFDTHIAGFDVEKARALLLHRLSDSSGLLGTNALLAVACYSSETFSYLCRPSNDLCARAVLLLSLRQSLQCVCQTHTRLCISSFSSNSHAALLVVLISRTAPSMCTKDPEVQWLVRIPLAHSYTYTHRAAAGGRRRAS